MDWMRLVEKGWMPDALVRRGIRRQLRTRLRAEASPTVEAEQESIRRSLAELRDDPIAIATDAANEQHYAVPPRFFERVLGRHRKYSCGYWAPGTTSLDEAEEAMLRLTVERADIQDGQSVLELGSGWGSLSLYMAARFPKARFVAISNSAQQQATVQGLAAERGLQNLEVRVDDMRTLALTERFDRIVSIEMFEHMRNYQALLAKVATWLVPDGRLFVHVFVHDRYAYRFETGPDASWMAKNFFTGGQMPSDALLLRFQDDLVVQDHWRVDGTHYAKTARAWLNNLDAHRDELRALLAEAPDAGSPQRVVAAWRVFFMACEELWAYDNGKAWYVSHYLFAPRG